MPKVPYQAVVSHPRYSTLSTEDKIKTAENYWNAFKQERPDNAEFADSALADAKSLVESSSKLGSAYAPIQRERARAESEALAARVALNDASASGRFKTQEEFDAARQATQDMAQSKVDRINKLGELYDDAKTKPVFDLLESKARGSALFGPTSLTSPDPEQDKLDYANTRARVAENYGIAPEQVDDIVRHRVGAYAKPVSMDVLGKVHVKDEILLQDSAKIRDTIQASDLPEKVRTKEATEAPLRAAAWKQTVIDRVQKTYPELSADIKWTGNVDNDFRAIAETLNTTATGAVSSGALQAAMGRAKYAELVPGSTAGVGLGGVGSIGEENIRRYGEAAASEKKLQAINELSDYINGSKTRIWGTPGATVGAGLYSVAESIALGAALPSAGTLILGERVTKAGKLGKALLGFSERYLNTTPIAGIYAVDQGLQTYEQAKSAGVNDEAATNAAVVGAANEFFWTTLFGGVKLGGTEDLGRKLATPAAREAAGKTIAQTMGQIGKGVLKTAAEENLEEGAIAAVNTLFVESQLNPNLTTDDLKKSLYDTLVATTLSSGLSGGGVETMQALAGRRADKATAGAPTDTLQEEADAIAQAQFSQQGMPTDATAGPATPGGVATAAPTQQTDVPNQENQTTAPPVQVSPMPTGEATPTSPVAPEGGPAVTGTAQAEAEGAVTPTVPQGPVPEWTGEAPPLPQQPSAFQGEEFPESFEERESLSARLPAGTLVESPRGVQMVKRPDGKWSLKENSEIEVPTPLSGSKVIAYPQQPSVAPGVQPQPQTTTTTDGQDEVQGQGQGRQEVLTRPVVAGEQPAATPETPRNVIRLRGTSSKARVAAEELLLTFGDPVDPDYDKKVWTDEGTIVEIGSFGDYISLMGIQTPRSERGQGKAQRTLDKILNYSDEVGVPVRIDVEPYGSGGLTKDKLKKWYSKNGFVEKKDSEDVMIYSPGARSSTPVDVNQPATSAQQATSSDTDVTQPSTTTTNEDQNQVQETSGIPAQQGQPANSPTAEQAQEGAAQREGQGPVEPPPPAATTPSPSPEDGDNDRIIRIKNAALNDFAKAIGLTERQKAENPTWAEAAQQAIDVIEQHRISASDPDAPKPKRSIGSELLMKMADPTFVSDEVDNYLFMHSLYAVSKELSREKARLAELQKDPNTQTADLVAVGSKIIALTHALDVGTQTKSERGSRAGAMLNAQKTYIREVDSYEYMVAAEVAMLKEQHPDGDFTVDYERILREYEDIKARNEAAAEKNAELEARVRQLEAEAVAKSSKKADAATVKPGERKLRNEVKTRAAAALERLRAKQGLFEGLGGGSGVNAELRGRDAEYLAAVEAGDMETAQRMVDEAARRAGYDTEAWHGSTEAFTVFDTGLRKSPRLKGGLFLSTNEKLADRYAKNLRNDPRMRSLVEEKMQLVSAMEEAYAPYGVPEGSVRSVVYDGPDKRRATESMKAVPKEIRSSYGERLEALNDQINILEIARADIETYGSLQPGSYKMIQEWYSNLRDNAEDGEEWAQRKLALLPTVPSFDQLNVTGVTRKFLVNTGRTKVEDARGATWSRTILGSEKTFEEASKGYDSIRVNNVLDSPLVSDYGTNDPYAGFIEEVNEEVLSDVLVVGDPSQIKSADPVTYDANGKPIPLSQRFGPSDSILYSTDKASQALASTYDHAGDLLDGLTGDLGAALRALVDSNPAVRRGLEQIKVKAGAPSFDGSTIRVSATEDTERTLTHETTHAVLDSALDNDEEFRTSVGRTRRLAAEAATPTVKTLLSKARAAYDRSSTALSFSQWFAQNVDRLASKESDSDRRAAYALTGNHEFLAALMSDNDFRAALEAAQAPRENRSLLQRFFDAIRALFGRTSSQSLLDRALKQVESAIRNPNYAAGPYTRSYGRSQELRPEIADDLAMVGSQYILDGAKSLEDFTKRLVADFGDAAAAHAQTVYGLAQGKLDTLRKAQKLPPSPAEVLGRIPPEGLDALTDKMVFDLVRGYMLMDVPEKQIFQRVLEDLQEFIPGLTYDQVSDAYTGYGKAKYPSDDELKTRLWHLREVGRKERQLREIKAGKRPLPTGLQRRTPTDAIRELDRQIKDHMKAAKLEGGRGIKSPLEAIKTRLRNQIRDLENALTSRKPFDARPKTPYDIETEALRKQRDELKQRYDEAFTTPDISDDERLSRAMAAVDAAIAREESLLFDGVFENAAKTGQNPLTDPAYLARRKYLKELRKTRAETARAMTPEQIEARELERAIKSLRERNAYNSAILASGKLPTRLASPQKFNPNAEFLSLLRESEELEAAKEELRKSERPKNDPEAAKESAALKAIAASEKRINDDMQFLLTLINSNMTPEQRAAALEQARAAAKAGKITADAKFFSVRVAKERRDAQRLILKALEKQLKVRKSPEQEYNDRRIAAAQRLGKHYEDLLRNKIWTRPERPERKLTDEAERAVFEAFQRKQGYFKGRGEALFAQAPVWAKVKYYTAGAGGFAKFIKLCGDLGTFFRNTLYTFQKVGSLEWNSLAQNIWRALRAGSDSDGAHALAIYNDVMSIPEVQHAVRKNGLRMSNPLAPQEWGKEDYPPMEFVTWMAKKSGLLLPAAKLARLVLRMERINTTYLLINRAESLLVMSKAFSSGRPLTEKEKKGAASFADVMTGRATLRSSFGKTVELAIPAANHTLFISANWTLSQIQYYLLVPIFTAGSFRQAARVARYGYLNNVMGRAMLLTATTLAYTALAGDDERRSKWKLGWNPNDPDFLKLYLGKGVIGFDPLDRNFLVANFGKSTIDYNGSFMPFLRFTISAVTRSMEKYGKPVPDERISYELSEEGKRLLLRQCNIVASNLWHTFILREYRDKQPVTAVSAAKAWFVPVITSDLVNIYKAEGPKGLLLFSQMFLGANVRVPTPPPTRTQSYESFERELRRLSR